jgi:hypothetical protein
MDASNFATRPDLSGRETKTPRAVVVSNQVNASKMEGEVDAICNI